MALDTTPNFDAPIPGMSLTAELGSRPWQSAPMHSTVDDAIQYYMDRMTSEDFMDQLIDVLEMGVAAVDIANTMQLSSVMEGIHNVDVGVLVSPVIVEMIMFIAESADIEYVSGLDNPNKDKISDAKMAKVIAELDQELQEKNTEEKLDGEQTEVMLEEVPVTNNEPMGLMARRT